MNTWERIKKVIKPHQIIILIILITSNSFAWFIYATKVDNTMNAHVRAWDVLFQAGDSPIVDYININIESMYPGMDDYHYELKAYNKSEVGAQVTYEILSANIMGTEYYPFKFDFAISNSIVDAEVGESLYTVDAKWPFESGDDELDTNWGKLAYDYKKNYPDNPSIELKVKIYITQITEETSG